MEHKNITLIICESTTGIALDRKLNYLDSTMIGDKEHMVFVNIEEVKKFIEENKAPNVSFEAFDKYGNLLYEEHIPPSKSTDTNSIVKHSWWKFWR